MKKLILSLCMCLLLITPAFAKNVRFAQVTDMYFKGKSQTLNAIIKDINKNSDIDFVVFTGNNIGKTNQENLKNFLTALKKLNKPYYIVLGNKDVSKNHGLEKKTYMSIVRKYNMLHPKKPNYTFKKGDIVFVVVDGSKELIPTMSGYYSKDTIEWVNKQLTKYSTNKVVILQHFPLANKADNEYYYTYNILEYMQMLSKHNNVLAVVTGHYNKNDEVTYNGVYHITSPRSSDGSYKIIEIDPDNNYSIYTLLKEVK